jgi:hypothetical protein
LFILKGLSLINNKYQNILYYGKNLYNVKCIKYILLSLYIASYCENKIKNKIKYYTLYFYS